MALGMIAVTKCHFERREPDQQIRRVEIRNVLKRKKPLSAEPRKVLRSGPRLSRDDP